MRCSNRQWALVWGYSGLVHLFVRFCCCLGFVVGCFGFFVGFFCEVWVVLALLEFLGEGFLRFFVCVCRGVLFICFCFCFLGSFFSFFFSF